jgi:aryl-alcohol dehydrogenase-like predicted oxidoreductase
LLGQVPDNLHAHFGAALTSDAQRALQFARSAPGVATALAGMSQIAHVDENLATAQVAPMNPAAFKKLLTQRYNT